MATITRSYKVESGKLVIRAGEAHVAPIVVEFGGVPVYKILPLLSGDRCLVLLDPGFSKAPTFENLLCVEPLGRVVWRAELPKPHDAFADVLLVGTHIEARTWNGYRVEIDPATGTSREIGFSK
jgi:hypothetical protein